MGAGHNAVAAALGDRLTAAGHQVSRADVLDLLPMGLGRAIRSFYHATISHFPVLYAGIYQVFFRDGAEPRPGGTPLAWPAADGLLALTARYRPDVVVPVFHLAAQVTGRLSRPRRPGGAERGGGDRLRRPPPVAASGQ